MAEDWPLSLPQAFQREGYREAFADGRLLSNVDRGPAKMRLVSAAVPRTASGRMIMTQAQLTALAAFVAGPLRGGALPFTFPWPGGGAVLARFADKGLPAVTALGGEYDVAFTLEILP